MVGLLRARIQFGTATCRSLAPALAWDATGTVRIATRITATAVATIEATTPHVGIFPLAKLDAIAVDDLLSVPLILMRAGYLMHRLLHRLLGGRTPSVSYSTDGGEMGKLMVAEGLGATVLPDFSLVDDPLERGGQITWRPLRDADTEVWLVIRRMRSGSHPRAARNLHSMFVERARTVESAGFLTPR